MPKPNHDWKVLPHGTLAEIDSGILAVEGELPMPLTRTSRTRPRLEINLCIGQRIGPQAPRFENIENDSREAHRSLAKAPL
ncbi:hypothetical protein [Variovorax sp. J22R115]|uniref:hypothetical protein n=1 Tax=Variovorax sp. J22R115 TaxID=3053509 RepID=UPI002576274D|nr:hypothetical protein [Variovorax sp. J22R115]MDM0050362.1 hypothetical protein [Variovorax sp. J22R115]